MENRLRSSGRMVSSGSNPTSAISHASAATFWLEAEAGLVAFAFTLPKLR